MISVSPTRRFPAVPGHLGGDPGCRRRRVVQPGDEGLALDPPGDVVPDQGVEHEQEQSRHGQCDLRSDRSQLDLGKVERLYSSPPTEVT